MTSVNANPVLSADSAVTSRAKSLSHQKIIEIKKKFWHCDALSLYDCFCKVYLRNPGERSLYVNFVFAGVPEPNGRIFDDVRWRIP
jgi:hypothetical protein